MPGFLNHPPEVKADAVEKPRMNTNGHEFTGCCFDSCLLVFIRGLAALFGLEVFIPQIWDKLRIVAKARWPNRNIECNGHRASFFSCLSWSRRYCFRLPMRRFLPPPISKPLKLETTLFVFYRPICWSFFWLIPSNRIRRA